MTFPLSAPLLDSALELPLVRKGKVRDVYAVGDQHLLIVATDRISAFDYVLGSGIPDKGRILTAMSLFWVLSAGSMKMPPSAVKPFASAQSMIGR